MRRWVPLEYLTLPQPLPVWVPVYDVKLEFQIGKLGDKLDALPLLILFMIDDHKSLEDIVMVTQLGAVIIQKEIQRMQKSGLLQFDGQLVPSGPGKRILQIYRMADSFSQGQQPFYVDGLSRKLHVHRSSDVLKEQLPEESSFACVKGTDIPTGRSKFLFGDTHKVVQSLLEKLESQLGSDEFNYLTYVGEKRYLQRHILKLPVFSPDDVTEKSGSIQETVQCEFPYNLYVLRLEEKNYTFYVDPVTQKLRTKKVAVPTFSSKKGILCFTNALSPQRELDMVREAIQKIALQGDQEVLWENLKTYPAMIRGYADGGELFEGDEDEA